MQQATEITRVAYARQRHFFASPSNLLLCSIFLGIISQCLGCTDKGRNGVAQETTGPLEDKSNARGILRRGLPGEPRTLDPQMADDTFSFPVLRDLYEGLTAEDRDGRIVPGVAESWTVNDSGT